MRHRSWCRIFSCVRKHFGIYSTAPDALAPKAAPYFTEALNPENPCAAGISGRCGSGRMPFTAPSFSPAYLEIGLPGTIFSIKKHSFSPSTPPWAGVTSPRVSFPGHSSKERTHRHTAPHTPPDSSVLTSGVLGFLALGAGLLTTPPDRLTKKSRTLAGT